jgi:fatty acyl-CoA reductase
MTAPRSTTWLITGVTGFLGKVVLEELLRREGELGLREVVVVIRAKGGRNAAERFKKEVVPAKCFSGLKPDWPSKVTVVDGDLGRPGLSLNAESLAIVGRVTHVVHSAASVNFNLPAGEAAAANITASLNMLDVVRPVPSLQRFIYVSTAYVTPNHGKGLAIPEALVPLPVPASELYARILAGETTDEELLALTGHPNTYTFTKCISEHLIAERVGAIPLSIVRPSIISAARATPFPGWIDSTSGFGAFVILIGLGHLRAVVGDPRARLDLVPVDDVATRVVGAAIEDRAPMQVTHAVAGLKFSPTVDECRRAIEHWFTLHRSERRPSLGYLGRSRFKFQVANWWHHRLPILIGAMRGPRHKRQAEKLASRLAYINEVFPYFTTRSFDYQTSRPLPATHLPGPYVTMVCRGIARHVLRRDDAEWVLAGRKSVLSEFDWRWAVGQPRGNAWVRFGSWCVTKFLRRTTEEVTVDLPSFERARLATPDGAAFVLVPSHRSYLDFVLCSYLAFSRPDLGFPIPHIAATMEFGKIPVLGWLLSAMHAFYLRRGTGKEDPELTRRVCDLIERGHALEFFPEGTRSRTREWLPAKRGLMRALQATGKHCALLPISISYDRLPEERSFHLELTGGPKPEMRLRGLLRWARRAWRGEVSLGRVHIACGAPVMLDAGSDVHQVADAVMAELKGAMAITTFHLDAYLAHHPIAGLDAKGLRKLIESRGGRVLSSALTPDETLTAPIAATMREHFAAYLTTVPAPALETVA